MRSALQRNAALRIAMHPLRRSFIGAERTQMRSRRTTTMLLPRNMPAQVEPGEGVWIWESNQEQNLRF
jgi:hypothetical protein